jgi:ankyrin repeat protein
LIKFGCDLEHIPNFYTPLARAVESSRPGPTELLANAKAGLDTQHSTTLNAPLHIAVQKAFRTGVSLLLDAGALVDIQNLSGATPLHAAVERGDRQTVDLLLKRGADASIKLQDGTTILDLAVRRGYENITGLLLDGGAAMDQTSTKFCRTPLNVAVGCNKAAIVRLLLDRGADINLPNKGEGGMMWSALHFAADTRSSVEILEILLKYKPALDLRDVENQTPLVIACRQPNIQKIQLLLTAGADATIAVTSSFPLVSRMLTQRKFAVAQLLFDHGASLDYRTARKDTHLHHAVSQDDQETALFLMKNKIEVDSKNMEDASPLMTAAMQDRPDIARILLQHGAAADLQDRTGNTALIHAAATGHLKVVSVLLEYKADPVILSKRGYHAIGAAQHYGNNDIEDLLVKFLESEGRVVYDIRWPGMPIILTREAKENGYELTVRYGRPWLVPKLSYPHDSRSSSTDSRRAVCGEPTSTGPS